MDVDAISFPSRLLGMLVAISESDFISFDLELSGIATRMAGPRGRDRQTLEERYAEVKQAAEKYQILQVGITCAKFDYLKNRYVLRPYNVNISPLVSERLDIERDITFQSGAVNFLLNHGFKMDLPFTSGVQYLSREEAKRAKEMAYNRLDKKNVIEDLQLREEDVDSLDFVRRVREAIIAWKATDAELLEVTTHTGFNEQPALLAISRFEKRLVHQLVRAEFPELVSAPRAGIIHIIHFDAVREAANTRKVKNRVKQQIATQSGFRWVIESFAQGDISSIDPFYFGRNTDGIIISVDEDGIKNRLDRAAMRLKTKQPVLVGHNMFTDLVYLYQHFIGPLPSTLAEFQHTLHELFPSIVDTKYLATCDGGDLNASPTLQEIAESLNTMPLPDIVTHSDHSKYHDKDAFHEAGYDSLLTATIMIRLSAKLNNERKSAEPSTLRGPMDSFGTAVEDPSFTSRFDDLHINRESASPAALEDSTNTCLDNLSLPSRDHERIVESVEQRAATKKIQRKRGKKKPSEPSETSKRRFATGNLFDGLQKLNPGDNSPDEEESTPPSQAKETYTNGKSKTNNTHSKSDANWEDVAYIPYHPNWTPIDKLERDPMELIPAFDAEFWKEFGNRVRCFGTEELVLKIAEWKK